MKSSPTKNIVVASAALLAFSVLALPSQAADTIGFNENAPADSTPAASGLVGFEFTLNQDIDLTQLGFYTQSIGGGDSPHVSLFDITSGITAAPTPMYDTGNLVASLPVSPGWNYVSVGTPILLTVGKTYLVSAPLYFSEQYASTTGFTLGGALASGTYVKGGGWTGSWANSSYDFTSLSATSPGANISADFKYTLAPTTTLQVPEPSTYAMLGAGLLTLLIAVRRRAVKR